MQSRWKAKMVALIVWAWPIIPRRVKRWAFLNDEYKAEQVGTIYVDRQEPSDIKASLQQHGLNVRETSRDNFED